ncbi:hypothetical protein HO173_002439 [Letharia columbiana]|uniref:Enoyl reductase (ER) domain-containing protein n=1 Tax=Letharia columbiana TaxID=112416 RepID=A0A8H6G2B0_9LECA|nr:uncharacterized protein HO173_002439 [Letharia columbiana]KAF6239178.1 hypothetical protein HO173_002439 [Letharia columbiana]
MAVLKVNSFSSRDTNIESGTLRANNNTSVDVLLNSIAGESLQASWRCIAPLVRFVEISKADSVQNSYLEVKRFLGSETFAGVDLTVVAKYEPDISIKLLTDVLELYRTSAIEAVSPITSFAMSELQIAMRLMQGGKHMGKIIIRSHGDEVVQVLPPLIYTTIAHADASYPITGGTGGIGRSLASWLAKNGAKPIVLVSRSGSSSASAHALVEEIDILDNGVPIAVRKCDVSNQAQLEDLINGIQGTMSPT